MAARVKLAQRQSWRRRCVDDGSEKLHHRSKSDWRITIRRLIIQFRSRSWDGRLVLFGSCAGVATVILLVGRGLRSRPRSHDSPIMVFEPRQISPSGVSDMCSLGYKPRPRSLGYYFNEWDNLVGVEELDPDFLHRHRQRDVYVHHGAIKAQALLENSKDFDDRWPDPFIEGDCTAQHSWQMTSFPSCNLLFEIDLADLEVGKKRHERVRLINNGYWRDVWSIREFDGTKKALKTLRYEHEFELRNYDRHRKDALISERLTASPNVRIYCHQMSLSPLSYFLVCCDLLSNILFFLPRLLTYLVFVETQQLLNLLMTETLKKLYGRNMGIRNLMKGKG